MKITPKNRRNFIMARHTKPLTDKEIKVTKAKEKDQKLFDGGGLFLTITIKGKKGWRLKYRHNGKEKLISLGVYPDVSLQEARRKREELKKQIAKGIDPSAERKHKKETLERNELKERYNFKYLADEYFDHILTLATIPSENHYEKQKRRVANHCIPYIGTILVHDIKKKDILNILKRIVTAGYHESARRVLALIKNILEYGVDQDILEYNVAASIQASKVIGKKKENHYPVITAPEELGILLLAIDEYKGNFFTKQALRIMPYVAQRPANIRFAEWSEIDFKNKTWCIPAVKMKMDREHIIFLTDATIAILRETEQFSAEEKYIFPSPIHKGQPLSENTLNVALRRLEYTKEELVSHSFRGIFSTVSHEKMNEHGCSSLAIEEQLAHKESNGVKRAYNHAKYFDERKKLLRWWSDYLDNLKQRATRI